MRKLISARLAGNLLLGIYGLLVIFHILVLAQIAPSSSVWGGQVGDSPKNLVALEATAIALTAFFALIVVAKIGYIRAGRLRGAVNVLVWIVFAYSLLNIAGNFASGAPAERLVFGPVSIVVAFLVFRLAVER